MLVGYFSGRTTSFRKTEQQACKVQRTVFGNIFTRAVENSVVSDFIW